MGKRGFAAGLSIVLLAGASAAKEPLAECGSYVTRVQEEAFLHLRHTVRRVTARLAASPAATALPRANQDVGDIAVIGAGQGVVGVRNPFDLGSRTVTFTPDPAGGYKVQAGASDTYDAAASQNGTRLTLSDDDTAQVAIPFAFPFYGINYGSAFVNSNGSVTFGTGDTDYSGTFGHFAGGPPAIAALFSDLNPPASANGVRFLAEAARVVVTWDGVPLVSDGSFSAGQTFQLRFYPTGRIELTYTTNADSLQNGVTGITPGGLQPVTLTDLTVPPATTFPGGVAESFTSSFTSDIDMMAAAQRFYQTHDDAYDYLVFYNSMAIPAGSGVVAYELTTRSSGQGYGDTPTNMGLDFGSRRQLQAVLNLGPTTQYPVDPSAIVPARGSIGDTPMSILGHESGHLFLALVSVPAPAGSITLPMLGAGLVHWAFPFNSDASFLEGNRIVDQGAGTTPRFLTTATVQRYSALDQYLMGFRAPQDVPPVFAVLNSGLSNPRPPQTGVSFSGTRLDISVDDVIKAAGRRTPDSTVAQRAFRFAFVMIVPEDADLSAGTPTAAAIAQVETYRAGFADYFAKATDFKATASTTLRRALTLSLAPASGVALNGLGNASIDLSAPTTAPLTFTLSAPLQVISAPTTITIPAGVTHADFSVSGTRVGVEELTVTASDPSYQTAVARVQVNPASALRVAITGGDKQIVGTGALPQPIAIRVVDQNNVPYSNQTVTALASAGGSVNQVSATTDNFGQAAFTWTPSSGSFNSLTLSVPGVPSTAVATALGKPAILPNGVKHAASFTQQIPAGGFASIFGGSLAGGVKVSAVGGAGFPTTLSGVQVSINGVAVPLSYVSDSQINFVVPAGMPSGVAQLVVGTPIGMSPSVPIQIAAVAPGVFFDAATGAGAVLVAGTGLTTQSRPALAGDFLEIYCTGLGGGAATTVSIAGVNVPVTYAGPTVVQGLQQVNVQVPAGLPPGTQSLVLSVGTVQGNSVSIQLQ